MHVARSVKFVIDNVELADAVSDVIHVVTFARRHNCGPELSDDDVRIMRDLAKRLLSRGQPPPSALAGLIDKLHGLIGQGDSSFFPFQVCPVGVTAKLRTANRGNFICDDCLKHYAVMHLRVDWMLEKLEKQQQPGPDVVMKQDDHGVADDQDFIATIGGANDCMIGSVSVPSVKVRRSPTRRDTYGVTSFDEHRDLSGIGSGRKIVIQQTRRRNVTKLGGALTGFVTDYPSKHFHGTFTLMPVDGPGFQATLAPDPHREEGCVVEKWGLIDRSDGERLPIPDSDVRDASVDIFDGVGKAHHKFVRGVLKRTLASGQKIVSLYGSTSCGTSIKEQSLAYRRRFWFAESKPRDSKTKFAPFGIGLKLTDVIGAALLEPGFLSSLLRNCSRNYNETALFRSFVRDRVTSAVFDPDGHNSRIPCRLFSNVSLSISRSGNRMKEMKYPLAMFCQTPLVFSIDETTSRPDQFDSKYFFLDSTVGFADSPSFHSASYRHVTSLFVSRGGIETWQEMDLLRRGKVFPELARLYYQPFVVDVPLQSAFSLLKDTAGYDKQFADLHQSNRKRPSLPLILMLPPKVTFDLKAVGNYSNKDFKIPDSRGDAVMDVDEAKRHDDRFYRFQMEFSGKERMKECITHSGNGRSLAKSDACVKPLDKFKLWTDLGREFVSVGDDTIVYELENVEKLATFPKPNLETSFVSALVSGGRGETNVDTHTPPSDNPYQADEGVHGCKRPYCLFPHTVLLSAKFVKHEIQDRELRRVFSEGYIKIVDRFYITGVEKSCCDADGKVDHGFFKSKMKKACDMTASDLKQTVFGMPPKSTDPQVTTDYFWLKEAIRFVDDFLRVWGTQLKEAERESLRKLLRLHRNVFEQMCFLAREKVIIGHPPEQGGSQAPLTLRKMLLEVSENVDKLKILLSFCGVFVDRFPDWAPVVTSRWNFLRNGAAGRGDLGDMNATESFHSQAHGKLKDCVKRGTEMRHRAHVVECKLPVRGERGFVRKENDAKIDSVYNVVRRAHVLNGGGLRNLVYNTDEVLKKITIGANIFVDSHVERDGPLESCSLIQFAMKKLKEERRGETKVSEDERMSLLKILDKKRADLEPFYNEVQELFEWLSMLKGKFRKNQTWLSWNMAEWPRGLATSSDDGEEEGEEGESGAERDDEATMFYRLRQVSVLESFLGRIMKSLSDQMSDSDAPPSQQAPPPWGSFWWLPPGFGKSLLAATVSAIFGTVSRSRETSIDTVLFCPVSVCDDWVEHLTMLRCCEFDVSVAKGTNLIRRSTNGARANDPRRAKSSHQPQFIIASYEFLLDTVKLKFPSLIPKYDGRDATDMTDRSLFWEEFLNKPDTFIIMDELQDALGSTSYLADAVKALKAKYRVGLTGTALSNWFSSLPVQLKTVLCSEGRVGSRDECVSAHGLHVSSICAHRDDPTMLGIKA